MRLSKRTENEELPVKTNDQGIKTEAASFSSNGKRISGLFRMPSGRGATLPCVVIIHGYSGYKEEYDGYAASLNAAGLATLQYDSRGCGSSEARLGRMLCATEWSEDADAAISWVARRPGVDPARLGITGCSMGGVLSLRTAASDPRIRAVVDMAAFSDGRDWLEELWTLRRGKAAWLSFLAEVEEDFALTLEGGPSREVTVPYALAMLPEMAAAWLEDRRGKSGLVTKVPLESARSLVGLRVAALCPAIEAPTLVIHGSEDDIVPLRHSREIYDALGCEKELVVLEGAPHNIPLWVGRGQAFDRAIEWFARHL